MDTIVGGWVAGYYCGSRKVGPVLWVCTKPRLCLVSVRGAACKLPPHPPHPHTQARSHKQHLPDSHLPHSMTVTLWPDKGQTPNQTTNQLVLAYQHVRALVKTVALDRDDFGSLCVGVCVPLIVPQIQMQIQIQIAFV